MEKNQTGKWAVFAYGSPTHATLAGKPITGDAANISANIRIDGGAANAVDDTAPTELEGGYYNFDITAVESNGDQLLLAPSSTTGHVIVIGVPGVVWTRPANFNDMSITETTGRAASDVVAISGSTAAADNMEATALTIDVCILDTVVNTHTPTITEFQTDTITEATGNHYIGSVIIFTSGALLKQRTRVTGYALVGGIGQFTVEEMTEAPANNDTFVVI